MSDAATLNTIRSDLIKLCDEQYAEFHARLIPTVDRNRIIGVRTPVLRKYAKSVSAADAEIFLNCLPHEYYDENNLHAFLIERVGEYDECIARLDEFLPFVDNWATCDLMSPKILRKNPNRLKEKALTWMNGRSVYEIRFGIKTIMDVFSDDLFSADLAEKIAAVESDEYYVNMMVAWYFATLLVKQPQAAYEIIEQKRLPVWTHNKAISKAIESYRVTKELKCQLRKLKINEKR